MAAIHDLGHPSLTPRLIVDPTSGAIASVHDIATAVIANIPVVDSLAPCTGGPPDSAESRRSCQIHRVVREAEGLLKDVPHHAKPDAIKHLATAIKASQGDLAARIFVQTEVVLTDQSDVPVQEKIEALIELALYQLSTNLREDAACTILSLKELIQDSSLRDSDRLYSLLVYIQLQQDIGNLDIVDDTLKEVEEILKRFLADPCQENSEKLSNVLHLYLLYAKRQNIPDTNRLLALAQTLSDLLDDEEYANYTLKIAQTKANASIILHTQEADIIGASHISDAYANVYFLLHLASTRFQEHSADVLALCNRMLTSLDDTMRNPAQIPFVTVALCCDVALFLIEINDTEKVHTLLEQALCVAKEGSQASPMYRAAIVSIAEVYEKLGASSRLEGLATAFENHPDIFHYVLLHLTIAQGLRQDFVGINRTIGRMSLPKYKVDAFLNLTCVHLHTNDREGAYQALNTVQELVKQMGGYELLSHDVTAYFLDILVDLADPAYIQGLLLGMQESSLYVKMLTALVKVQVALSRPEEAELTLRSIQPADQRILASAIMVYLLQKQAWEEPLADN